jgi:hypothetical protein
MLPLQYVAISNAGELYSYPGDDTGIWQRGSLLPWGKLPFRPFVGSVFRVVRQPFWSLSMPVSQASFQNQPERAEAFYRRFLRHDPAPRPWDLIFTVVNSAIWLAFAFALNTVVQRRQRPPGAHPWSFVLLIVIVIALLFAIAGADYAILVSRSTH